MHSIKETITFISPHQDDIALSLACFLYQLALKKRDIQVVNCFTQSSYAPYSDFTLRKDITNMRNLEDRNFYAQVDPSGAFHIYNLSEPDSLIRLSNQDLDYHLLDRPLDTEDIIDCFRIRKKLIGLIKGIVMLPMAIEYHIDHVLACLAGLSTITTCDNLCFYLDVPSWLRTEMQDICKRVDTVENMIACKLVPYIYSSEYNWDKRALSTIYKSQISEQELNAFASAPFQGEIFLVPSKSLVAQKLSLRKVTWTDLRT